MFNRKYKKYKKLYRLGDVIDIHFVNTEFDFGVITELNKDFIRLRTIYYHNSTDIDRDIVYKIIKVRLNSIDTISLGDSSYRPNNLPNGLYAGKRSKGVPNNEQARYF